MVDHIPNVPVGVVWLGACKETQEKLWCASKGDNQLFIE